MRRGEVEPRAYANVTKSNQPNKGENTHIRDVSNLNYQFQTRAQMHMLIHSRAHAHARHSASTKMHNMHLFLKEHRRSVLLKGGG